MRQVSLRNSFNEAASPGQAGGAYRNIAEACTIRKAYRGLYTGYSSEKMLTMQIGNPLPVFLGITLMACFCGYLSRHLAVLDEVSPAHAKTLSLDGLRGILASSVFFHHATISYFFFRTGRWDRPASNFYGQLGPSAVTMFFFISGFLFWQKMLRDPASVSVRRLLPNRARRILPAYLLAILILYIVVAFLSDFHLRESAGEVLKELVSWLLAGFPYLGGPFTNLFNPVYMTGGIFWTLQMEWLFYFLLPLLTWFRPIRKFFLPVLIAMGASFVIPRLPVTGFYRTSLADTMHTFTHLFWAGFAFGMFAAYGKRGERVDRILTSPWMTPVAILLLVVQFGYVPAGYNDLEPWLLAPIFFMIIAGNSFHGLLSSRAFRALGTVSFSMYVLHGLLLHLLLMLLEHFRPIDTIDPLPYWLCILVFGLVITLCATISFRFVEKPFFARRPARS